MKLFSKQTINRDINLLFLIASFIIVIFILKKPWYFLLLIYLIYFIIKYFIFFGTSLGNTGYFVQAFLHNEELAIKFYKLAVRFNTKSSYGLTTYGLYLLKNNQPKEAINLFKKILSIKSTKPLIKKYNYTNIAICYWKLNKLDKALEIFHKMLVEYEYFNADFYTTFGYLYILKKDYENAAKYTKLAFKENKDHGPAYDNLGQICYRQGDIDKAEEYFLKALELKETMADSKYFLGLIYEQKHDLDKAKKYFKKAYNSNINGLNTVTREQVDKKYNEYFN